MQGHANISTDRDQLYDRLNKRNNLVGFLRIAVPGFGLLVAGLLIFQIVLSNLAENFGASGIHLDRDQLVIDTPRYAGVMSDGTIYDLVAEAARAAVDNTDIINMDVATINLEQTDGYTMVANAELARLHLTDQQVFVEGLMITRDSNGVDGQLHDSVIDWPSQILTANGPVQFDFESGSAIKAQSLVYNAKRQVWDFKQVIYTVPGDGGVLDE